MSLDDVNPYSDQCYYQQRWIMECAGFFRNPEWHDRYDPYWTWDQTKTGGFR